jgi:hypothetical protein
MPRPRPVDEPLPFAVASVAAIIGADSGFAQLPMGQGDVTVKGEPATTPEGGAPGWKIQLAAASSRKEAEGVLDRALSTGQAVLASAKPYTEPVTVAKQTLYRARFSGFRSQEAANAACAFLVKRSFDCLATSN